VSDFWLILDIMSLAAIENQFICSQKERSELWGLLAIEDSEFS